MNEEKIQPYSRALVRLLKGVVERDDCVWNEIIQYQAEIQKYLNVIGLVLIVKRDEGFAFLKQMKLEDDTTLNITSRRKLGFEVSVIIIILRQLLEDFDSDPTKSQSTDKYVTVEEIRDEVEMVLPQKFNKVKFEKDLSNNIDKVVSLGYLVDTKQSESNPRYKIHRIIKEKVTLDDLIDFKHQIEDYYAADESL